MQETNSRDALSKQFDDAVPSTKEPPVSVKAPIVFKVDTETDAAPLIEFALQLKRHPNKEIVQAESERLAPYFRAYGNHLRKVAQDIFEKKRIIARPTARTKNKDNINSILTENGLAGLFNDMAAYTHNVLISDVAILSNKFLLPENPARDLFQGTFNVNYWNDGYLMSFGFVQIHKFDKKNNNNESVTFPVFMIDYQMMDAIQSYKPDTLLSEFQKMMTFVNHDMLHHLSSPGIRNDVAKDFRSYNSNNPVMFWYDNLLNGDYERWAQIIHEKSLLDDANKSLMPAVEKNIDDYFSELKRISDCIQDKKLAATVISFYGMAMAHAMCRVFPLNHPYIDTCFDRLKEIDPNPDYLFEKLGCAKKFDRMVEGLSVKQSNIFNIKKQVATDLAAANLIYAYKRSGYEILPEKDEDINYHHLRKYELIKMCSEDLKPHVPTEFFDMALNSERSNADKTTFDLMIAVHRLSRPVK